MMSWMDLTVLRTDMAKLAAHQTREGKQHLSREEARDAHQKMAAEYGQQPQRVFAEAAQRDGVELKPEPSQRAAHYV